MQGHQTETMERFRMLVDTGTVMPMVEIPVEAKPPVVMPVVEEPNVSDIEKNLMRLDLSDDRAVFEYLANHAYQQRGSDDVCISRYRGPDGTASVFGCLLTDEEARIGDKRSLSIQGLIKEISTVAERLKDVDIEMLYALYRIHRNQDGWKVELLDELWYDLGGKTGQWKPVPLKWKGSTDAWLNGSSLTKLRKRRRQSNRNCRCNGTGADGCR